MKEFNLELALTGHPVVTKDGNEVTHLALQEFPGDDYPLTGYIVNNSSTTSWAKSGKYYLGVVNDPIAGSKDLFLKNCDWQPPIAEGAIVEVRDNPDHNWVERSYLKTLVNGLYLCIDVNAIDAMERGYNITAKAWKYLKQ